MNKYIVLTIMAFGLFSSNSHAQTGSAFSYQGELVDNGSPANGLYDITVSLFLTETGGSSIESQLTKDVVVENGLFNLEIDFGDMVYENNEQYYLETKVVDFVGGGASVTLAPRTKLLSVPYATQAQFLADGGGSWEGDETFQYTPGKVSIGTSVSSERLYVQSIGSEHVFRARTPDGTKLLVQSNGGSSIGIAAATPENGLFVQGDVKQDVSSNGMLKYMLKVGCDSSPTIFQEYNGTNVVGVANISQSNTGSCVIKMPFNLLNSYISVTATQSNGKTINCSIFNPIPFDLNCDLTTSATGSGVDGIYHILVY